jgi:NADPH-dependent curcumin reductase CurA
VNAINIAVPTMGNFIKERVSVEKFISAANVAKRFNVTARTVVRWIADGDLPGSFRVTPGVKNSPFLIPLSSVEEFEKKFPERIRDASDTNGDGVTKN